ncbi:MAG: hypothetical protein IT160_00400 [Bryobacterales bacterium]|nr:hypothetical protein [Bryobacterales bacterium]
MTDAEYEAVREFCIAEGWRSVSDFARSAVLANVQPKDSSGSLTRDLTTLSSRLKEIDSALNDVSGLIRRVLGPGEE